MAPAPLAGKGTGEVVDAGVVVTGADPVAVADGLVALPDGKGGIMVAEVGSGMGATTVGVVAGAEVAEEVVDMVELDDEEADEVKEADWGLCVPLGLSHAWVSM